MSGNKKFPRTHTGRLAADMVLRYYTHDVARDSAALTYYLLFAIFPLLKNKPELVEKARAIYQELGQRWLSFYDESGAIGRRYRRQDEVGTPFGITVDFQTLEDQTVTLRERDSMKQERVAIADLASRLASHLG